MPSSALSHPRRIAPQLVVCLVALLAMCHGGASREARAEVFNATHRVVVGDAETRLHASERCREEARRAILEQIGTYTEARAVVRDFELQEDEIHSFVAGALRVLNATDELTMENDAVILTCAVTAEADAAAIRATLEERGAKAVARERFRQWREEAHAANPGSDPLAGPGLAESGNDALTADMVREEAERLAAERRRLAALAEETAYLGMTTTEAGRVLGAPTTQYVADNALCARYGDLWFVFRNQQLDCVRTRLSREPGHGECHCAGMGMDFVLR